jgi:peptidoglycan/xylan/chitin deacetylase (PgdA/CDA1 family)
VLGTLTQVETSDPVAALTFDDGPHPEYTPRLLALLEKYQARATFFMLGEAAYQYPELVRQISQAGHALGNHSWDHPSFPLIPSRKRREQLRACERALAPYGQRLFRPPYGQQNVASYLDALRSGYEVVTWSVEVGDWWDHDVLRMTNLLVSQTQPGSIIVLHDALRSHSRADCRPLLTRDAWVDREPMLAATAAFLEQTRKFRFVTLPELLRHGRPYRQHWYKTVQPERSEVVA